LVLRDVVIVGAGPAGSLAALILARRGARVALYDREQFPRPKLCGDTLNPGALRVLARHMPLAEIARRAIPLDGMILTGPRVSVRGAYGQNVHGQAMVRRDLDMLLLTEATRAGVEFRDRTSISAPVLDAQRRVVGVRTRGRSGHAGDERAAMVIAADGRGSRLARAVALARYPAHPRRWAIGGYFEDADVDRQYGEMHVRRGLYIGVAPVPGDLTNVCLVMPHLSGDGGWRDPAAMLLDVTRTDARLAHRFARARLVDGPRVLGPMAVDASAAGVSGMLLAGDAAGFIDPITGDGLRLAFESATLAADVVLDVLAGRVDRREAAAALAGKRQRAFANKWRFNRTIRSLVATPSAVSGAAIAARLAPRAFAAVIRYAGDCA
jgi:menaquinone-9 beta-reductase